MPTFNSFPDFTGSMIANGQYRFIEQLGTGSFGAVYLAIDEVTNGPSRPLFYAIKCIRRFEVGSRHDILQAREFQMQQRVQRHPNIVKIREIYADDDFQYVILDLCAGGDMCTAIQEGYFVGNDAFIKSTFLQILDAVEHCHKRHVAHRDLKPDNILLSADKTKVFLADFGLAYQGLRSDEFGTGTKAYMAPECYSWNREMIQTYGTLEGDIWSLGIILAGMISGSAPWSKALPSDEFFNSFLDDPYFFQNYLRVSPSAGRLLDKILHIDPNARLSIDQIRQEIINIDAFFPRQVEEELYINPFDLGTDDPITCIPSIVAELLSDDDTLASEDITALKLSTCIDAPSDINAKATDINGGKDRILYPGPFASYLDFPKPPGYRPAPMGLGIFI